MQMVARALFRGRTEIQTDRVKL